VAAILQDLELAGEMLQQVFVDAYLHLREPIQRFLRQGIDERAPYRGALDDLLRLARLRQVSTS